MGGKTLRNKQGLTEEEYLKRYDVSTFERPSVTVDTLVFTVMNEEKENYRKLPEKSLKLLMVRRGEHPYIGEWALPGGFVGMKESIEEAALRELKTETNVENIYFEQLYTWGEVERDPRTRVISCSYLSLIDNNAMEIKAGDDADDAKWFTVKYNLLQEEKNHTKDGFVLCRTVKIELSSESENIYAIVRVTKSVEGKVTEIKRKITEKAGIAFDHALMMEYAIERLRNKIEYTDIVFNLMPELFTLTELQQVYEIVLGKDLLAANFRRKTADMVIETEEYTKDAGHRPSKLYRFNSDWKSEAF